jgi:phosphate-selective porin OprO/OprP
MNIPLRTRHVLLGALLPLAAVPGFAAEAEELAALRTQVQQLEQQLKVLARKLELQEQAATAAAPATPKITATDKGVTIASADGANSLKIRGLVQLDSRLFFNDGGGIANNSFVLRRARLIAEGTFLKNYSFQLVPEFGGSSVSIVDANFTVALTPAAQLRFGKFKVPVGLELLQSDSWTFFNERSIATNLVPNRDLGVQLSGDLFGGRLNYAAGVFNGLPDGGSTSNSDFDNDKDVAGRLFATPFRNEAGSPLQGLSFGLGGSVGRQKSASGRASAYRTDGQQTFFAWNSGVVADGSVWRLSPQADYRFGSLGAQAEYVLSTVNLRPSATGARTELRNRGWQLSAGYVLTGEDSSFNGVTPATNFDWSAGTWGAFELAARYASLKIDDAAFPAFASPASSADEATSWSVGLNWYLTRVVRFSFDYYDTHFGFSPLAPVVPSTQILRQDEKALITRFQLSF